MDHSSPTTTRPFVSQVDKDRLRKDMEDKVYKATFMLPLYGRQRPLAAARLEFLADTLKHHADDAVAKEGRKVNKQYARVWVEASKLVVASTLPSYAAIKRALENGDNGLPSSHPQGVFATSDEEYADMEAMVYETANTAIADAVKRAPLSPLQSPRARSSYGAFLRTLLRTLRQQSPRASRYISPPEKRSREAGRYRKYISNRSRKLKNHKKSKSHIKIKIGKRTKRRRY